MEVTKGGDDENWILVNDGNGDNQFNNSLSPKRVVNRGVDKIGERNPFFETYGAVKPSSPETDRVYSPQNKTEDNSAQQYKVIELAGLIFTGLAMFYMYFHFTNQLKSSTQ